MSLRVAICVTLVVLVALLALSPVAVGHGPFSSVYGPASTLRAYRAAVQLQSVVAAIFIVLFNFAALRSSLSPIARLIAPDFAVATSFSFVSSILRC